MNLDAIHTALVRRWPDDRFLHVYEAPIDPSRLGRKIDVLVLGLWRSHGWTVEATEVKRSYSDWRREIEVVQWEIIGPAGQVLRTMKSKPTASTAAYYARRAGAPIEDVPVRRVTVPDTEKSEEWRLRSHRYWIAAPVALAERIAADVAELKLGWGVLGVIEGEAPVEVLRGIRNPSPKPLGQGAWLGVVRAAANSGVNALQRSYDRGYADGQKGNYRWMVA